MDNVLITGDTGFLGRTLSHELNTMGYTVHGLPNSAKNGRIDISKPFALNYEAFINTVIHTAGKAHSVPTSEAERQHFYDVNFEGTKNLCYALEKLVVVPRNFIFISTVAVYGVDLGYLINEEDALNGKTAYADSKILAEEWLKLWAEERGVNLVILRLPLVAGPNPPGNLGAMISGIKSGKYLSIGQANAQKSMVWAEDIARIIPALTEKGGTYNLTDGHHPTFGELEKNIAAALGKRKPTKVPCWMAKSLALTGDVIGSRFPINSDKLQKITSTLTFDDSKARRELGWNPTPVLDKIADMVK